MDPATCRPATRRSAHPRRDCVPQVAVLLWVRSIKASPHDCCRGCRQARQRVPVSRRIDAARQTRQHDHASLGEFAPETSCRRTPCLRGIASSDNAHSPSIKDAEVAAYEQHRRAHRIGGELRRHRRVCRSQHLDTGCDRRLPAVPWIAPSGRLLPRVGQAAVFREHCSNGGRRKMCSCRHSVWLVRRDHEYT